MDKKIVFIDGQCILCDGLVGFLSHIDTHKRLYFSSLQGETAKLLSFDDLQNFQTVIFHKDGKLFYRTDAVVEIFHCIGGAWKALIVLKIIPRSFRDYIYKIVAKSRYKLFGKKTVCSINNGDPRQILP